MADPLRLRHARSETSHLGWLSTGASFNYNAATGFGWSTQPMPDDRMATGRLYRRETNLRMGWLTATLVLNPSLFSWGIDSQRNVRDKSLFKDGEKRMVQGDGGGSDPAPVFDASTFSWPIDSQRITRTPDRIDATIDTDWITPAIIAPFDPSAFAWAQDSPRMAKSRVERVLSWTKSGYFISLFFNPAQEGWVVDSQLGPRFPYWSSDQISTDWIPTEVRAPFDQAVRSWPIDSQRVPGKPYWNSAWTGNDWITPELLAELAHDPSTDNWAIPTSTYQSRAWWTDSPRPNAWLIPAVIFDARFFPATAISSHRELPPMVGRWQPDLDNAWQNANPVVPNTFNPSFTTGANEMVEPGNFSPPFGPAVRVVVATYVLDETGEPIMMQDGSGFILEESFL